MFKDEDEDDDGAAEESEGGKVDFVFVTDNSSSMEEESAAIAFGSDAFFAVLADQEVAFQAGIVTTSVEYDGGDNYMKVDPGEGGLLLGDPTVLSSSDADVAGDFQANLLCEATCWNESSLASDSAYTCGDDTDAVSIEFLDCICGEEAWQDHCGSGQEEHLEASLMALCRAVDDPPEGCWDESSIFSDDDIGTNSALIREAGGAMGTASTIAVVISTDEGDGSRRLSQGDDDLSAYTDVFDAFDRDIRFFVVGPPWDRDSGSLDCNSGNATTWGIERLQGMVESTGGLYYGIEEVNSSGDCETTDMEDFLLEVIKAL